MKALTKVVIIGIDSLDSILLNRFRSKLPNFDKVISMGKQIPVQGIFPPDSPASWASIYTGMNPAEHGIIYFIDPLDRVTTLIGKEIDQSPIKGQTFWDKASRMEKRVCILNPLIGYPPWKVNGVMIGRATTKEVYKSEPTNIGFDISLLSHPRHSFQFSKESIFLDYTLKAIVEETRCAKELFRKEDWDLFFFYSSYLDTVQHDFWSFYDERDPGYVKDNKLKHVIEDFYQVYDKVVGEFIKLIDEETTLIIVSDHGHDMRPPYLININEILRREGLLKDLGGIKVILVEKMKKKVVQFVTKFNLGRIARWALVKFPSGKKLYTSPLSIDLESSMAFLSDLSGIKAYSYGGIKISKRIAKKDYEEIRDQIIKKMSSIKDLKGKLVFKWIKKREKLYEGPFLYKYPDIVFRLEDGLGAGWEVGNKTKIFVKSDSHNLFPGSHRGETPVFLIKTSQSYYKKFDSITTISDIFHVIMTVLEIQRKRNHN